jgi:demethylmenaquinone methyltransferase/2-methoxy-6-polyprenyl-1,4-benzoquinol methylase
MQHPATPRAAAPPPSPAALAQYRQRADHYDQELAMFEPIRTEAIERLQLTPGETVLDVGCGTGLSLAPLRRGVGRHGRIVAIEQSPDMLGRAAERVRRHGWHNVELVQTTAAGAPLHGYADAALFHFTHDVLRDDDSIANVLAHLKPGARVVASGLQWAPPWMWPTNGFVLMAALYSVTSLEGMGRPWDKLAERLRDVKVDTALFGGIYIASGRYRP